MDPITTKVAANVRAEMGRAGVSQAELASVLGLSQAAVSKRLRGSTRWRVDELAATASHLGVPLAVLLPSEVAA